MINIHPLGFRDARAPDSPAIRAILTDTFEAYGIDLPANYSFADIEDIAGAYIDTGGAFVVLTQSDRLIGFFGLAAGNGRRVELKRLYVHADERGRGFGDHLVRRALRIATQMEYAAIHLETTSRFKEAVGLYKKHGFVDDPEADRSPGHDIAMMKVL